MIVPHVVAAADADGPVITRGGAHNIVFQTWGSLPHYLLVELPDLATMRKLRPWGVQPPGLRGRGEPQVFQMIFVMMLVGTPTVEGIQYGLSVQCILAVL